jgi:hypothetical protein
MDRGRSELQSGGKRSFDEFDYDEGRRQMREVKGWVELEDRRHREREHERD